MVLVKMIMVTRQAST